jgi:hypothetical protein
VYATVHHFHRQAADRSPGWGADLAARFHGGDTPSGFCVLAEFGGREGVAVSYWPTRDAASRAASQRIDGGVLALDVTVYEVIERNTGISAGEQPAVAQLVAFDGPRSQAQAAASERAGQERLLPAVQHVPGLVGVHVLRDEDNAVLVISLTTSLEALEAGQRAVLATELLPDEDPALLDEPDRVQIHRVIAARLPATSRTEQPA